MYTKFRTSATNATPYLYHSDHGKTPNRSFGVSSERGHVSSADPLREGSKECAALLRARREAR